MFLKILRNLFIALAVVIISFGVGYRAGSRSLNGNIIESINIIGQESTSSKTPVNFTIFWDVWDRLQHGYIDKKVLNAQKMVYGAVSGMVASLGDPYTVFLPPDQNKDAKEDLGGRFDGIGAQLGVKDKKIVIIAPLKGTPAEKAGLRPGDWIVKVDGKESAGWTLPEAVSKIRGPKGTKVILTILHKEASNSAEIAVMRDIINVASVEWELKDVNCLAQGGSTDNCGKVAYLKLSKFGDQTADEWNKAVKEIWSATQEDTKNKIKGLVLDLRNNPGGYLSGSVFIASEFLGDGTVVIQESANGFKQNYTVNRKGKLLTIPMVVLINKGSASASEIVAGALSVRGRSRLVGETSFGKGTIQEAQDLENGAGIHITTARWLLPNGKWANGNGVEPDIKVINDETKPETDAQLDKAVEMLVK